MNFKIIVGILLQMALLASCLLAIDPTQPGDYHKQYLDYKIPKLDAHIAIAQKIYDKNRTNEHQLNVLKNRKSRYVAMSEDPNLPKILETPPREVKVGVNGSRAKVNYTNGTNGQGAVIPVIVYIGYEINRIEYYWASATPRTIIQIEADQDDAIADLRNELSVRGLLEVAYHTEYLYYKIAKLKNKNGSAERLAYFTEEAREQRLRPNNGTPFKLPMALPEIDVPRMKYTDENGLPIDKLMYIGYEIAYMKSESNRRQIREPYREICKSNLNDALQDMKDELAAYHLAQNANKLDNAPVISNVVAQRAQRTAGHQQVPMPKTSHGNSQSHSAMMNEARMVLNTTGVQGGNAASNSNAHDVQEQIRALTEQIEKLRGTFPAAGNGRRV